MVELGEAYQYKQGVGLISKKPFKILSVGDYRVAEIQIGNPSWLQKNFQPDDHKLYTGFDPSKARWLNGSSSYIAVFDFDTDIQLDIEECFKAVADKSKTAPNPNTLGDKLMAGSIWKAQVRTRELRAKKSWWQENPHIVAFFIACFWGALIFYFAFNQHLQYNVQVNGLTPGQYVAILNQSKMINGALNTTAQTLGSVINAGSAIAKAGGSVTVP